MVVLSFVAALCVAVSATAEAETVLYLISQPTVVRADPDARAKPVARLERFEVVSGKESVKGWLQVEGLTGDPSGWVPLVTDNVITGPIEAFRRRAVHVQHTKWPDHVKLDVMRGRVREGFSGNQVQLAIGDPLKKELRHVGDDVIEEWIYADRRVVFSHTGVKAIALISPTQ